MRPTMKDLRSRERKRPLSSRQLYVVRQLFGLSVANVLFAPFAASADPLPHFC